MTAAALERICVRAAARPDEEGLEMQARTIVVSACAALALGAQARAEETKATGPTTAPSPTSERQAPQADRASQAAQPGANEAPSASPGATEQTVIGNVQKVEQGKLTLKSSELSDPHEVKLDKNTQFTREGRPISRDQIKEGDQVRATFTGEPGSTRAAEIRVIKSQQGKPAMQKEQRGTGATSPSGSQTEPSTSGGQSGQQ